MSASIWAVGEIADGGLVRISTEIATLARDLAAASGGTASGLVVGAAPGPAAGELAGYLPAVRAVSVAGADGRTVAATTAMAVADLIAADGEGGPTLLLLGATPDGRDVAGMLSALLGWGVLVNASAVTWDAAVGGPVVEMSTFGGRLITTNTFTGSHGIVTIRPQSVTAEPAAGPGVVEAVAVSDSPVLRPVELVDRVAEAGAEAPIEEARIIVAGGRGVGGPEGFATVRTLADALGGAVGATRAAVDAGWIPYATQIGQTGKTVKPALYLALGISGAIQHKVGMQTAETIVAVNRDPDAPIAEFADLFVVGDLFEVVPALVAALRSRGT
jgi:electron transfer flavoprotein alpha subunit